MTADMISVPDTNDVIFVSLSTEINLHFAFEAYRPKLGKSLKKIKGAKSTAESFLAGGMYGKCLISPPFLRLEAILIFVYFLLNFKLDAIFSDCEKSLDKRYFAAQKGLI